MDLALLIFFTLIGACIGSFLNVVAYRLPAGKSLVKPPSSCPRCNHRLAWYDNVPVFGWLWLRGACRYCKAPISPQYPVVEAVTALLFGGWYYVAYMTDLRPQFAGPGFEPTALIFLAYLGLIGSLVAAVLIDAKYYMIPLVLSWVPVGVAIVLIPAAVFFFPRTVAQVEVPFHSGSGLTLTENQRRQAVRDPYASAAEVRVVIRKHAPGPVEVSAAALPSGRAAAAAWAGVLGLAGSILLLRLNILPRSFADEAPFMAAAPAPADDPHPWLRYPHARREMLKELLFLALPLAGFILGLVIAPDDASWPGGLRAIGGVCLGYLAGGAVVWFIRIFGTLGFGKEAMGLGDAHLMAAVGAVCGWEVAVLAFFVAPFFGLLWALISIGLGHILKKRFQPIPYGPHLAAATAVVCVLREPMVSYFGVLWMGGV